MRCRSVPMSLVLGVVGAGTLLTGCHRAGPDLPAPLALSVTSHDIAGGMLSSYASCDGPGSSPHLAWNAPPPGTKSFAVTATDEDAHMGFRFVHWVIFNIPADTTELGKGASKALPSTTREGLNDDGTLEYYPPCPPTGETHHYRFVVYATDALITSADQVSKRDLLHALQDHVLAKGMIDVQYTRSHAP
jgi:Raf kinase inhibitor-like YbhB/YbcL family protein